MNKSTIATNFFFALTPERVLDSIEALGFRCTGRCLALNSYENRVYEIELESKDEKLSRANYQNYRVAKFYRPHRWSEAQIREEHEYLLELKAMEIPVVAPVQDENGESLYYLEDVQIYYGLFEKVGGRIPDELDGNQLQWIGRLLGRIHNVGAGKTSNHRPALTPQTYGRDNLDYLLRNRFVPHQLEESYKAVVEQICTFTEGLYANLLQPKDIMRIHGDCHRGNLLWGNDGPFFLDFDDFLMGPAVQDVWLLIPARDAESKRDLNAMLEGYEEMRPFNRSHLALVEPLRALRSIRYSAWLAKRWDDPAFKSTFSYFDTHAYWEEKVHELREILGLLHEST